MTRRAVTVGAETPVSEIDSLTVHSGFERLPVVRDTKVIGIVSRQIPCRPFLGGSIRCRFRLWAIRKKIMEEIREFI